ncbi:MAG TPA: hypothetical protein VNF47_03960 [Streptosporangiaceae bacterium]|nr:hypothetical protein [Streptosporangiaceae bacterium]
MRTTHPAVAVTSATQKSDRRGRPGDPGGSGSAAATGSAFRRYHWTRFARYEIVIV